MPRILITGNSGSGKSTLARDLATRFACVNVDLDTVAWEEGVSPPARRALAASAARIDALLDGHDDWVVEECYADLLDLALPRATALVFLDPGIEACQENCRRRPFEPHKYSSPKEQDANLPMLHGLRRKFTHPKLARVLLATGERPLAENSPTDAYWGVGPTGDGRNRLGVLLMQVRGELQNTLGTDVSG